MIHMAQVAQLVPAQVLQQRGRQKQSAPVEADAPLGACRREGCAAFLAALGVTPIVVDFAAMAVVEAP